MKYMVIETHEGYAIVLSEDGVFKKVANLQYEVGQIVDTVFDMKEPESRFYTKNIIRGSLAVMSALAVIIIAILINGTTSNQIFASVMLKINPEVRININQDNDVLSLEGVNQDGQMLIEGYAYENKKLDPVMDELVDLAIEKGFLYDGGQVNITFDAEDQQWLIEATDNMKQHVQQNIHQKVSATFVVGDTLTNKFELIIPIEPPIEESDYDDNDYGQPQESDDDDVIDDVEVDYGDSDYDYDDSDYDDSEYDD